MRYGDNCRLETIGGMKFPKFKGHVKLTLRDIRTGRTIQKVEADNIVTNALRDILAANYVGAVDYSKVFGSDGFWKKWFGGILLYEQAHTLDADNYFPKSDGNNHLWGHAGQTSIDANHDDDLTRGNPLSIAVTHTADSVKLVWEFGPTRANVPDGRYIRSLSLTHADTGDAGLGSDTYAFRNFQPFEAIAQESFKTIPTTQKTIFNGQLFGQYDDSHGFSFFIGDEGEYSTSKLLFATNKVTIYIKKFPYLKGGLYETWSVDNTYVRSFTITSANITFYSQPAFYFDYENKRLWLFSNITSTGLAYDKSHINYIVIDCESGTEVAHGTIISDAQDLGAIGGFYNAYGYQWGASFLPYNIIFDGTYFYFPTGGNVQGITGFKKINLTNQSDQAVISFLNSQPYVQPVRAGELLVACGHDFVAEIYAGTAPGIVVNGNTGYPCAAVGFLNNSAMDAYNLQDKPSFEGMCVGITRNITTVNRGIFANKMVNTTLFNLPSPVQKTSSSSMTVEYTLTQIGEEDES